MVSPEITSSLESEIFAAIRRAGGRLTVPMRAIVAILADGDAHPTADDIIDQVNRRIPGIAPSTIYRVLARLDELGIVEHVHAGMGPAFYQLHESSHVHLVCNVCGAIINISERAFAELSESVFSDYGFELEPRHAALLGRCAACAASSTADRPHRHVASTPHTH